MKISKKVVGTVKYYLGADVTITEKNIKRAYRLAALDPERSNKRITKEANEVLREERQALNARLRDGAPMQHEDLDLCLDEAPISRYFDRVVV